MKIKQYLSIGNNCRATTVLKNLGIRKQSLPFDWGYGTPRTVYEAYKDGFNQLINCNQDDFEYFVDPKQKSYFPVYRYQFMHRVHADLNVLRRRATRMREILHSGDKMLLVYNNNITPVMPLHKEFIEKTPSEWMDLIYLHKLKLLLPDNIDILCINYGPPQQKEFNNIIYRYAKKLVTNPTGKTEMGYIQPIIEDCINRTARNI